MKSKISGIERCEGGIKRVQREIEQGGCHPLWGEKLIARYGKTIDKKEKALLKKRK